MTTHNTQRTPDVGQQVTWKDPYTGGYDSAAFQHATDDGMWVVSRGRRPGWTTEQSGRTYTFRIRPEWARNPQRKGGYQPEA